MNIAYTIAPGRGDTDLLLQRLATDLAARGVRTCGTVQINSERPGSLPCDMDIQVLPAGPVLRISQELGAGSRGCRLDPAALEQAVALCEAEVAEGPDILIINKFGKHEAEGRGFRALIAEALGQGIPVLVGLNRLSREAFDKFCEGLAVELAPDIQALRGWAEQVLALERV
ncbi:DUF2478 domain-containing protein [Frigidibacter sp. ROC022]|uniref:DUF2478 domain-containing protein n=1 Tax=Frigidibacter sp. ROC022 TaxID=2971796 RepID=UPI00215AC7EA|nr:DUF2478 domain-containing protein [Frigidibacter sp. ROC022]MCR8726020.1 DUF2478 domain-containing protein [Frigidibacter sp. ROC022]